MRRMYRIGKQITLVLFAIVCLAQTAVAQSGDFETMAETTDYRLTASYDETVDYLRRLDDASEWVKLTTYGTSPQGRAQNLLIVSKDGAFDPETAHATGKVILFIQNGIHSGEIDGKDACLALVRDIVITREKEDFLDNVILLIDPIFNLDGHENRVRYTRPNQIGPENAGFRTTAQLYNLNRDYLKADSPEMRAWIRNWRRWMPDFFIDDHVTDGQDWPYTISYTAAWHPNSAPSIREWTKTFYDPYVTAKVTKQGFKVFPYAFFMGNKPSDGVTTFVDIPRFSTGYTALWNRPGVLIEMHSLKDYKTRVQGNYAMLVATLEVLNKNAAALKTAIAEADAATVAGLTDPHPLTFDRSGNSDTIDVELFAADTILSAASGTTYLRYHQDRILKYRIPYFNDFKAEESVVPPRAYLIPREWQDQIALLRVHGVLLDTLTQPLTATVEHYQIDSVKFASSSFEGHVRPQYRTTVQETTLTFPTGTVVVDLHQHAAKVAMQALEPKGPDSFLSWGMWNTILEQKEYIESYMIDPLAGKMLAEDPELREEFLRKLQNDREFASDTRQRRDFFYKRSEFTETTFGWYPAARLMDQMPPANRWEE